MTAAEANPPESVLVKRYPNRKLYDTKAKKYVTLAGVAELVRAGADVRVIDHATGDDVTAATLAQVILEQERRQHGSVPHAYLEEVIRAGEEALEIAQEKISLAARRVRRIDDEIEQRLLRLVGRGHLSGEQGRSLRQSLMSRPAAARDEEWNFEAEVASKLRSLGMPGRADLESLQSRVDAMAAQLDRLERSGDSSLSEPADL